VLALAGLIASGGSAQADLSRLRNLLDASPEGSWIKASTGVWSAAWPAGSGNAPLSIVTAWSSFAWDSTNDQLLLWGGGHANYSGNEMYVWSAATGSWSRGSLPSALVNGGNSNFYVVDNAAPQSAHTYDNSLYLSANRQFFTLGGAVYNTGSVFRTADCSAPLNCTNVQRAGPWLWDPSKADPNKVGGTTGSGIDPGALGGNMWTNRAGSLVGSQAPSAVQGAAATRVEMIGGVPTDVVYFTGENQANGFPTLYRYTVGNVAGGGLDRIEAIGATYNTVIFQGAATIDEAGNSFIRTTAGGDPSAPDLAVWNLANANVGRPGQNRDTAVRLVDSTTGSDFSITDKFGIDYDSVSGTLLLWDGASSGVVWQTSPQYDAQGTALSTWLVTPIANAGSQAPIGNFQNGVLGKWHYVDTLGAFVALDNYDASTMDAGVWLYKPLASAVPEVPKWALLLCGALLLIRLLRREAMPDHIALRNGAGTAT
jgi:hypothetical protein